MKTRSEHQGQTIAGHDAVTADFDSFFNLLVVVPEETDCYETLAIINYFGFPINVEEDNVRRLVRKEMGFDANMDTDPYPLLTIDSTCPGMPETAQAGKKDVLSFLYNSALIGDFRSRSAWETQGF